MGEEPPGDAVSKPCCFGWSLSHGHRREEPDVCGGKPPPHMAVAGVAGGERLRDLGLIRDSSNGVSRAACLACWGLSMSDDSGVLETSSAVRSVIRDRIPQKQTLPKLKKKRKPPCLLPPEHTKPLMSRGNPTGGKSIKRLGRFQN